MEKKRSGLLAEVYSYFKDSTFTAVGRDAKFETGQVKGVPFVNRRYRKGILFLLKMVFKRVRGRTRGGAPPPPPLKKVF